MLVEDAMMLDPPSCFESQRLGTAVRVMHDRNAAGVAVMSNSGRIVGILSIQDLLRWETRRAASKRWVRMLKDPVIVAQVMTHEVVELRPDQTISEAARVMQYVGRSVLPVVDVEGVLVGMFSARDIGAALARSDDAIEAEIRERLVGLDDPTSVAAITAHVRDGVVSIPAPLITGDGGRSVRQAVASVSGVTGIESATGH